MFGWLCRATCSFVSTSSMLLKFKKSAPNERVLRTTQLAKLGFNHPSVVLTADVFHFLNKKCSWGQQLSFQKTRHDFSTLWQAFSPGDVKKCPLLSLMSYWSIFERNLFANFCMIVLSPDEMHSRALVPGIVTVVNTSWIIRPRVAVKTWLVSFCTAWFLYTINRLVRLWI